MAKRTKPQRKKATPRPRPEPQPEVEVENPAETPEAKAFDLIIPPEPKPEPREVPEPKDAPVRYTGSHQICPRCGAHDTKTYKSMPIKDGIRVQYRRCQRAVCRHEFKAPFTVV
jgi:NMD protein affecting ribosome stability and mRNA decay